MLINVIHRIYVTIKPLKFKVVVARLITDLIENILYIAFNYKLEFNPAEDSIKSSETILINVAAKKITSGKVEVHNYHFFKTINSRV